MNNAELRKLAEAMGATAEIVADLPTGAKFPQIKSWVYRIDVTDITESADCPKLHTHAYFLSPNVIQVVVTTQPK